MVTKRLFKFSVAVVFLHSYLVTKNWKIDDHAIIGNLYNFLIAIEKVENLMDSERSAR